MNWLTTRRSVSAAAICAAASMALASCTSVSGSSSSQSLKPGVGSGVGGGATSLPAALYGPTPANPTHGGSLTIGDLVEPPALDPYHQAADARIQISVLMYQGLMYASPDGEAKPLLATSVKVSPDGKTYTFKLRRGVKFHTGQTMTAQDVKYSYDYIRDPANGSPGAEDYKTIASIDAPSADTVVFHLTKPNSAFLMSLTNKYGGVVPKDYFSSKNAAAQMNVHDVGTGPFTLDSFKQNSYVKLKGFKGYWQPGVPYLDSVTFLFMPNTGSLVVGLKSGKVDMAVIPSPQDAVQLQGVSNLSMATFPSLNQKALDLDCADPKLRNVKLRQAIAAGISKQQIAQAAYPGYAQVLGTMVGAMQDKWGLPLNQVPYQQRDPAKAKQLLAEAGYKNGVNLTLQTIQGYGWMDSAAVAIQQELDPIGIHIKIQKVDLGVWIKNFQDHHMGFTFNDWSTQPDPDLLFYRHFHSRPEGSDFRNWNNAQGSALLDQARKETSTSDRVATYRSFQKVLGRTVPTIMLFSPKYIVVTNKRVHNYYQHPTGWYFGIAKTYVNGS